MKQHGRNATIENFSNVFFRNFGFALHNHLIALDRNNFASVFINEVLVPTLQHTSSETLTQRLLHILLIYLNLLGKVEDLQDVAVVFVADGTQQSSYRKFFLTVDVSIHHIVDIGSELNPRTFERNDTRRIEHCSVSMNTLSEENAR